MTETFKSIWCDHGGRSGKAPVVIDVWACDADGRGWISLAHEIMGDADELHRLDLVYAAEIGYNVDAHLDRNGKNRHIGGVRRTKRGWQLTCPCGRSPRVRHHRMVTLLPYKGFGNLFPQVEPFADPFENPSGTLRTRRNPSQWAGPFAVPLLLVGGTSVAVSP